MHKRAGTRPFLLDAASPLFGGSGDSQRGCHCVRVFARDVKCCCCPTLQNSVKMGEISPIALKKLAIKKACQSFVGTEGDFGFNSPQISVDSAQVSSDF